MSTAPDSAPDSDPGCGVPPGRGPLYVRCPVCRGDSPYCPPGFVCERGFVQASPVESVELRQRVTDLEREVEQYRRVTQEGVRLPAPDLGQDPAYLAFTLGTLEAERASLKAELAAARGRVGSLEGRLRQAWGEADRLVRLARERDWGEVANQLAPLADVFRDGALPALGVAPGHDSGGEA